MLARRFTIVCLLTALFGMGLSMLVAQASNRPRAWEGGAIQSCQGQQALACAFGLAKT